MGLVGKKSPQQQGVYDAQVALPPAVTFAGVEEAQAYADSITSRYWWDERYRPVNRVEVEKTHGNAQHSYASYDEDSCCGIVHLSPGGMNDRVMIHEMAHTVTIAVDGYAGHGGIFVRRYLELVNLIRGSDDYLILWTAFKDAGVDMG